MHCVAFKNTLYLNCTKVGAISSLVVICVQRYSDLTERRAMLLHCANLRSALSRSLKSRNQQELLTINRDLSARLPGLGTPHFAVVLVIFAEPT